MANNIDNILKAADKVLKFPSTTNIDVGREYGLTIPSVTGWLVGGLIMRSPLTMAAIWANSKVKKNLSEKEEQERMKNEIIRKQQAIINKLKGQNEIKNLKDAIKMLESTMNQ